ESGIDGEQISKTGDEKSRAGQQHKCDRHLSDNKNSPQVAGSASSGCRPAFFMQNGAEVHVEKVCDGNQTNQGSYNYSQHESRADDGEIDLNFICARQTIQ